jgi:hypothetical protein
MRELARLAFEGDKDGRTEGTYILLQLLAAQVVAKAAYDRIQFTSLHEIKQAVWKVAGYPIDNPIEGSATRRESTVQTEAAYRVAALVGLNVEE